MGGRKIGTFLFGSSTPGNGPGTFQAPCFPPPLSPRNRYLLAHTNSTKRRVGRRGGGGGGVGGEG